MTVRKILHSKHSKAILLNELLLHMYLTFSKFQYDKGNCCCCRRVITIILRVDRTLNRLIKIFKMVIKIFKTQLIRIPVSVFCLNALCFFSFFHTLCFE